MCPHAHLRPYLRFGLFDKTPSLSYASEVWAVDENVGKIAKKVHTHFL